MTPIEAGKAFVRFVLDDKGLESKLGSIAGKFRKFGSIGLAATGPILAGFAAAATHFSIAGDRLDKMSKRTGLAVESLSELDHAAAASGTSLETIEKAAAFLQKKGIDPRRFDEIADSIAAIPDPTARAQAAMEAFGTKTGRSLLPLLNDLPQLREEARRMGLVMGTDNANAAAKLNDAFGLVKEQLAALSIQIGAAIAGPLTNFLSWASNILAWLINFVRENPRLVAAIAAITLGIAAASAAAVTFGVILAVISAHPIIAALTAISALVIGLTTYFAAASDEVGAFAKVLDGLLHTLALPLGLLKDLVEKLTGITGLIGKVGNLFGFEGRFEVVEPLKTPAVEGARLQSQLSTAVSASTVSPIANASPVVRDSTAEIVRWTRETSEGVATLVRLLQKTPGILGAF